MTDTRDEGRTDAPERIWLQVDPEGEHYDDPLTYSLDGVTWCVDQINDTDVEYVRAPTSDTEDECICDGVQDWTCPIHGYDGSDAEDVGEVSWTEMLLEEIANNGPGEIYFSPERAKTILARLRRTPETEAPVPFEIVDMDIAGLTLWVDASGLPEGFDISNAFDGIAFVATQDPNAGGEDG